MPIAPTEKALSRARELLARDDATRLVALAFDELEARYAGVDRQRLAGRAAYEALWNNLSVLVAAWGSNANHDPDPEAASAWRDASSAAGELLETD